MDPIGILNLLEGPGEQIVFLPFKNVLGFVRDFMLFLNLSRFRKDFGRVSCIENDINSFPKHR